METATITGEVHSDAAGENKKEEDQQKPDAMDVDGGEETGKGGGEIYRIPGHAAWFRWDAVHSVEKKGLPEFFTGTSESKTPETYHAYRCAMMSQYRQLAPRGKRLVFTIARRGLVGDVNTLQRVFDFLERWGLINWQTSDGHGGVSNSSGGGQQWLQ